MPRTMKAMQSLLGTALFYKPFVAMYSDIVAPLYTSTHKDFNWTDQAAVTALEAPFSALLTSLAEATALYYPNYDLPWCLRTDASDRGVGGVLYQTTPEGTIQPIMFLSSAFSATARRWSTIEKECYACFFCVKSMDYYLRCKPFLLLTDHNNLLWMQSSVVPKIMRWFIYLQSFVYTVEHVAGTKNKFADLLSRIHVQIPASTPEDRCLLLTSVHGQRAGHHGIHRTLKLLDDLYPGHSISTETVSRFISECPTCQKYRVDFNPSLPPITKTLRADSLRSVVAVDTLEIGLDNHDNRYILVVYNLFSKLVHLFPVAHKDAVTTANCLMQYYAIYGLHDVLHSDPGSDFMSKVVSHLLTWLGIQHTVTLVNNPQADGVKRINREILKHLRCLVSDERIHADWSSPHILPWVQLQLNSVCSSESGVTPYHAMFGSLDAKYFDLLNTLDTTTPSDAYVKALAENLSVIRECSRQYQMTRKATRTESSPPESLNRFSEGDFVLQLVDTPGGKLLSRKKGPHRVYRHHPGSNTVTVRSLITDALFDVNQKVLQRFVGTAADAKRMAQLDDHQYAVDRILGHKGCPEHRTQMQFFVRFGDGDELWLPYSVDISDTQAMHDYCTPDPYLRLLLTSADQVRNMRTAITRNPVDKNWLKRDFLLNLQIFSHWYENIFPADDKFTSQYYVHGLVMSVDAKKRDYTIFLPIFRQKFTVTNWFLYLHCSKCSVDPPARVIDQEFLNAHPQMPKPK